MQALANIHIGDVFEAPWGRYVFKGIVQDGRPVLVEVGTAGTCVTPLLDRIGEGKEYRPAGRMEIRDLSVRGVRNAEVDVRPVVVPVVQGVDAHADHRPSEGEVGTAPWKPRSNVAGARTTLGALRPTANTIGMVRNADGAGSVAILATVETLYWLPCPVLTESMPVEQSANTVSVPLNKAGDVVAIPHAFHIASSFHGGIYCPACLARKRGRVLPLPVVPPTAPSAQIPASPAGSVELAPAGALSLAPDDGGRVASRSHGSDGQTARDGALASPPAPPFTPPRGETAAASEEAPLIDPELVAIAARIEQRFFDRDDPKREVASFERTPPHPPAPAAAAPPPHPKRPSWHNEMPQPNRAVMERAEWWDERAAIMGEDRSITRAQADELAYEDMKRAYARGEIW